MTEVDGTVQLVVGPTGAGKTLWAAWQVGEVLALGRRVLWLDLEMGRRRMGGWIKRLGWDVGWISAGPDGEGDGWRLEYVDLVGGRGNGVEGLAMAARWADVEAAKVAMEAGGWSFDYVVVDSLSRALAREGEGSGSVNVENDSMFIASFMARLAGWARAGAHVLVLDHTGHGPDAQERPRGSSAKLQQADEGLALDVLVPWSRETPGAVAFRAVKDRRGRWAEGEMVGVMAVAPDPEGLLGEAGMVRIDWLEPWVPDDMAAIAGWVGRAEEVAAAAHDRRPRAAARPGERRRGVKVDPLGSPEMSAVLDIMADGLERSLSEAMRAAGLDADVHGNGYKLVGLGWRELEDRGLAETVGSKTRGKRRLTADGLGWLSSLSVSEGLGTE